METKIMTLTEEEASQQQDQLKSSAAVTTVVSEEEEEEDEECEETEEAEDVNNAADEQVEKIPVTILTGFLGAGKTTLVNHILKGDHGFKFAVIENEYGDVGVDQDIIKHQKAEVDFQKEEIIETINGCICCNVRGDISKVVEKLIKRRKEGSHFTNIIIETTGLADPGPVAETFFASSVADYCTLDGIITVVDAKYFLHHLREKKSDGAVNETIEQIAFADRIILNKIDLVNESQLDEIRTEMKAINSSATVFETKRSEIDVKHLINISSFDLERVLEFKPNFAADKNKKNKDSKDEGHHHDHDDHGHDHKDCTEKTCDKKDHKHSHDHENGHNHKHDHEHDRLVGSISITYEGSVSLFKLDTFFTGIMNEFGDQLYRYKGVISVAGRDQPFVFNGVHMNFEGNFISKWPENEPRISRFCLIGRELDRKLVEELFEECKTKDLRFKIGDAVEVNVDEQFVPGKVDCIWDEGCTYRIRLDNPDEDGDVVWAPDDTDQYIRSLNEKPVDTDTNNFSSDAPDAKRQKVN